ncbi:hypothetical protein H5A21_01665 [Pectobacterium aquaticum]|nr:hypothetical protein [Pectobacterium aquaticum]MBN3062823.1 hypothetical protein [Pectobacterium aquaticum]
MAVVRRFASDLENKLNRLFYMNYVTIERWELLCWFGADRITKSVWNDIHEKWKSWFDEDECPMIKVIRCDDTSAAQKFVLVRGDYLQDITDFSE